MAGGEHGNGATAKVAFGVFGTIVAVLAGWLARVEGRVGPLDRSDAEQGVRIGALEAKAEHLDVSLQREMRDLNASQDIAIDALDRRLQAEMTNNNANLRTSHESNRERLAALEQKQAAFEALAERVRAMERVMYVEKGGP